MKPELTKRLYLNPKDLELESGNHHGRQLYQRIIAHEISGLESMGCRVENQVGYIRVYSPESKQHLAFLNRIIAINTDTEHLRDVANLIKSLHDTPVSFEISPYTKPSCTEEILKNEGFRHVLSSDVLGKELTSTEQLPGTPFEIKRITDSKSANDLYHVFSKFFLKDGETESEARERLRHNLAHGPHLIVYLDNRPVGMTGGIIFEDMASAYAGYIDPEFRRTNVVLRLTKELCRELFKDGARYVYFKSRNRAVIYGGKIFLGLKHLYNERIYEN